MRPALFAVCFSALAASHASARCFAPVCGWGYGYATVYVRPWVVVSPPLAVPLRPRPGLFELDQVPTGGGVDLNDLREKLARGDRAKANLAAAVSAGEVIVFEPGKAPPKRAEVPPVRIPDAPKAAPPADPKALARWHLQRGHRAFDAGELGRATERFATAVAADPTLGEAHFHMMQTRIARGQYAEAMDAIRAGMKGVPTWADQRFRADDLYLANPKRLAADVADLKAAADANPTNGTMTFLYAHHLWFGGDKAKAKELFATLKDKVKEKEMVEAFVK